MIRKSDETRRLHFKEGIKSYGVSRGLPAAVSLPASIMIFKLPVTVPAVDVST